VNETSARTAGRAVVLDPTGRVLMIRGEDPHDPNRGGFWFTPGGGLDPGESAEAGIRRELLEELGLSVGAVGAVVMHRRDLFPFAGELYLQTEVIHLIEVPAPFDPEPGALTDLEKQVITEFRWFSADDLRELEEDSYPVALAALLDHLVEFGPPDPPWVEDLTASR